MPNLKLARGLIHVAILALAVIGLFAATAIISFARNNSTQRKLDRLQYFQTLCAKQNPDSNSCREAAKLQAQIDRDNARNPGGSSTPSPHLFPRPLANSPGPCNPIADVNGNNVVDDNDRVLILSYMASEWSRRPHIPYAIPAPSGVTAGSTDLAQGHQFYLVPGRGDLNFDGRVDAVDARMLKDYINGYINTFPRCDHPMPSPLPPAPAWSNQSQYNLSISDAGVTSMTFTWNPQLATGSSYYIKLWEGDCIHPHNAGEYYANTSKIVNYGQQPHPIIYWDQPAKSYTFRNLKSGQAYCAYISEGINDIGGLPSYSNDVAKSTQTSSAGTYVGMDSDGDTFLDRLEEAIGTNPNLACGQNAWPPDFNNDRKVTISDLTTTISKTIGAYDRRYDLNNNGVVNIDDVNIVKSYYNKTC